MRDAARGLDCGPGLKPFARRLRPGATSPRHAPARQGARALRCPCIRPSSPTTSPPSPAWHSMSVVSGPTRCGYFGPAWNTVFPTPPANACGLADGSSSRSEALPDDAPAAATGCSATDATPHHQAYLPRGARPRPASWEALLRARAAAHGGRPAGDWAWLVTAAAASA
jgi:hypothetical protein